MIRTFSASLGAYIAHCFPDLLQRNENSFGMQVSSLLQPKTSKVSFFFGGDDHFPIKKNPGSRSSGHTTSTGT